MKKLREERAVKYRELHEVQLRLKAPIFVMEKIVENRFVSRIFLQTALDELNKALKLVERMSQKRKI